MSVIPVHDAVFPLLADPEGYVACTWDLQKQPKKRAYWLELFATHFPSLLDEALRDAADRGQDPADVRRRAEQARRNLEAWLAQIKADPYGLERLDILEICWQRERILRQAGFQDPYRLAKREQNRSALAVLPSWLDELDSQPLPQRYQSLIAGVFAGNIFDMGATQTNRMFEAGRGVDFAKTRKSLKPRPWLRDDLDLWLTRLAGPAHRAAVLFVDNAGPDIILGMIPFARELLRRGTRVILAANCLPSLNDVTIDELQALMAQVGAADDLIKDAQTDGRLQCVPSGCDAPLIDLQRLSHQLVAVVNRAQVDLVVIEGMGRAIETNLEVSMTCDVMKIAMIKDQGVAEALGGELYDLVMRFEPAS